MAEKTYLELSESDGSHKFYEVEVDGTQVNIRYGRIGTDGTKQALSFADATAAQKEAEKKLKEKRKKGYEDAVQGVRKKRKITRRFVESTPTPQTTSTGSGLGSGSRRSSSSSSYNRTSAAPTPKLPSVWRFASNAMAFGIFINESACWLGNQDGRVFKLSHTGEVLEQYKLPEGVKCIVADDAWIYAGCDDGNVYDLTGKLPRIAYEISEDVDIFWLDVNNGWLAVSDGDGNAALFDYEGNESWRRKGKGNSAWMIRANFNGEVFYGDSTGVACYDGTGKETWHTKTGSVLFGYQDKYVLYAGTSQANMVCLSKTGEVLQTFKTDASVYSCAATEDGRYVFGGDNQGNVYCFNTEGQRLWKLATNLGSVLSMQHFKDNLYIVTTFGYLACVDVSEEAIQKAQTGDTPTLTDIKAPEAVAVAQTNLLEVASQNTQGIRVQCVKEGGKLRVKVLDEGYHKDWYVQFPRDIRIEGMQYIVDELKESAQGGFYRVLGNIFKVS
ncbi:WGR domain-containing protein [Xanthocytophaga agilis]|uniref:WGR domain-containing protein n=1 Tax=Xanthocytophaga agilis TaxID=3048010 RepID=A0AAE3RA82_9BACT|nr:WGR domain-containing protein [Xanthocytophaga agilis]MDJ1506534.1 WGR domain-containing protein [Xanthocytophaga agilis]